MTARAGRARLASWILASLSMATVACDDGTTPIRREVLENATYLTLDGEEITLTAGQAVGEAGVRHELLLTAEGNLDFDSESDVAALLLEDHGRERFLTLHAMLGDGEGVVDVSARLLGDRIEVGRLGVADGLVRVDARLRRPHDPVVARPSVDRTLYFAVTDRGLVPTTQAGDAAAEDAAAYRGEVGNDAASGSHTLHTHEWTLDSFDSGEWSADLEALEDAVTLRFQSQAIEAGGVAGHLKGFGGCNRIFGSFRTYAGEALRFYGLAAMRRECPPSRAEIERRLLQALSSVRAFRIADDRLTLALAAGAIRLRAAGRIAPPHAEASTSSD